mmetsp:Transcript_5760/g.12580  ORF Transcript_5760/g.12580 Transcript_5760/m.12580 type:complete len:255 (+) Transcript_5760:471-1235(+)
MMPKRNMIIVIAKRHNPPRIRLGNRKETLQYIPHASSQRRLEIVQYDMRIRLRHGRAPPLQIVTQHPPAQREVRRGPQRQVTHDQTVRLPPRLLHHHQIGKVRRLADVDQLVHAMSTAIDPRAIRNEQLHLLRELLESTARGATRRDAHPRIAPSRIAVLVVDVTRIALVFGVLVIDVGFEFVVGGAEFGGEGFALGEGVADSFFGFVVGGFDGGEGFAVEVFAAEAGVASVGGGGGVGGWHYCFVVGCAYIYI